MAHPQGQLNHLKWYLPVSICQVQPSDLKVKFLQSCTLNSFPDHRLCSKVLFPMSLPSCRTILLSRASDCYFVHAGEKFIFWSLVLMSCRKDSSESSAWISPALWFWTWLWFSDALLFNSSIQAAYFSSVDLHPSFGGKSSATYTLVVHFQVTPLFWCRSTLSVFSRD